jgi:adenosylcobinamide-GDP ribazoletransferase
MKQSLRQILTAFRFLTIIPLPWFSQNDSDYFPGSVKFFGLIGLLIGVSASILTHLFSSFLPNPLLCCFLLLYLSLISGFLHLDGIADTADGFFSSRPKEKILAIMKDSRTGAMGVIALVFLLLIKLCAFLSMPHEVLPLAAFFLPLAGRCAIVYTMNFLPYARAEGGLGQLFYTMNKTGNLWITTLIFFSGGFLVNFPLTILLLCVLLAVVALFGVWCKRMIGGITGDTLGAVCETTEATVAVSMSIFFTI